MRPALFLDLDSTVRYTVDPTKPCPNRVEEIRIYPGVVDKIKIFKNASFYIFGVSNQGGIELGHITEEDCAELMEATNHMMEGVFDEIVWAPLLKSYDRKPNPGMVLKLASEYGVDLKNSIMVGDKDSDRDCATNAGVGQFFYARDFFIEGHKKVEEEQKSYTDLMR